MVGNYNKTIITKKNNKKKTRLKHLFNENEFREKRTENQETAKVKVQAQAFEVIHVAKELGFASNFGKGKKVNSFFPFNIDAGTNFFRY